MTSGRFKRSADEMFADEDILEMWEKGEGEFAYGKKPKIGFVPLTDNNPTPSMIPTTPQQVVATETAENTPLQPTIQIMMPKKRQRDDAEDDTAQIKLRRSTPITSNLAVETVDVELPLIPNTRYRPKHLQYRPRYSQSVDATLPRKRPVIPQYRLHPSMTKVVSSTTVTRRKRRRRKRGSRKSRQKVPKVAVGVKYHPSITPTRRRLPVGLAYHPSIVP